MGALGATGMIIGIVVDCVLTAAIAYAYFPQLRSIYEATNGVPPSFKGISQHYLLSHAWFTGCLLSYLIIIGSIKHDAAQARGYGSVSTISYNVAVLQFAMPWLCSISMIFLFVLGYNQTVGYQQSRSYGKITIPTLVAVHAFIFILLAWSAVGDRTIAGGIVSGILGMVNIVLTPLLIPYQAYMQYRELRDAEDLGAFNMKSFLSQASVFALMGARWAVEAGILLGEGDFRRDLIGWVFNLYFKFSLPMYLLAWAAAVLFVYRKLASRLKDKVAAEVIFLD